MIFTILLNLCFIFLFVPLNAEKEVPLREEDVEVPSTLEAPIHLPDESSREKWFQDQIDLRRGIDQDRRRSEQQRLREERRERWDRQQEIQRQRDEDRRRLEDKRREEEQRELRERRRREDRLRYEENLRRGGGRPL